MASRRGGAAAGAQSARPFPETTAARPSPGADGARARMVMLL
ncbi:hypothetical protein WMF30_37765 [Sorangium sp. So ce134]